MSGGGGTGYANEETEWDAKLRQMGIKAGPEPQKKGLGPWKSAEEEEAKEKAEKLGEASLDELNELEDDEDEAVLQKYRAARLAELKAQAMARAAGVQEISKDQWKEHVTETAMERKVVVLLFKPGEEWSGLLEQRLATVAGRFPNTKFVKIVYNAAIPNYPESQVPTLLIYDREEPIRKIVGVQAYGGGSKMTADDVEWTLHVMGAVKSKMEENPRGHTATTSQNYIGKGLVLEDD